MQKYRPDKLNLVVEISIPDDLDINSSMYPAVIPIEEIRQDISDNGFENDEVWIDLEYENGKIEHDLCYVVKIVSVDLIRDNS